MSHFTFLSWVTLFGLEEAVGAVLTFQLVEPVELSTWCNALLDDEQFAAERGDNGQMSEVASHGN